MSFSLKCFFLKLIKLFYFDLLRNFSSSSRMIWSIFEQMWKVAMFLFKRNFLSINFVLFSTTFCENDSWLVHEQFNHWTVNSISRINSSRKNWIIWIIPSFLRIVYERKRFFYFIRWLYWVIIYSIFRTIVRRTIHHEKYRSLKNIRKSENNSISISWIVIPKLYEKSTNTRCAMERFNSEGKQRLT